MEFRLCLDDRNINKHTPQYEAPMYIKAIFGTITGSTSSPKLIWNMASGWFHYKKNSWDYTAVILMGCCIVLAHVLYWWALCIPFPIELINLSFII